MSPEQKKDPALEPAENAQRPRERDEPAEAADEAKTGLKYEFKIAPVDPKSAFDFEDVADK